MMTNLSSDIVPANAPMAFPARVKPSPRFDERLL